MKLDFNLAKEVREEVISVPGWIYPLSVRFGIFKYSWETYLIWQVLQTEHIFRVPLKIVTAKHDGKYTDHFVVALKQFREDLLEWKKLGLPEKWMEGYYDQFKELIVL